MRKKIIILGCVVLAAQALAVNMEVKAGFNTGTKDDNRSSVSVLPKYGLKAEALFGESIEYGLGFGYHEFGKTETSNTSLDGKSYITSQMLYGTAKFNLENESFRPYLRLSAGMTYNDGGNYFDASAEEYEESYIADGADSASVDISVGNGIYGALGLGMEYNDFIFEMIYETITATRDVEGSTTTGGVVTNINSLPGDGISIDTVTLEFGYKFDLK